MKISIAMATYNGAKYLQEQLDSFVSQTLLPDELIVCDDGSTDETIKILTRFSQVAPFKVNIFRNEKNLGFAKNFDKAISFCSGEHIFISDQDDIWFTNKLELVLNHFNKSGVEVVINDIEITYNKKANINSILNEFHKNKVSDDNFCHGCATAVKRDFYKRVNPPAYLNISHDVWIHKIAIMLKVRSILPKVLQIYRRHEDNFSNQQIGHSSIIENIKRFFSANKKETVKQWKITIDQNNEFLKIMKEFNISKDDKNYHYLTNQSNFYKNRILNINSNRLPRIKTIVTMSFTKQYQYTNGWRSALFDLLI
jgi:glycosyltransferase involved in cell wall biosynthesis